MTLANSLDVVPTSGVGWPWDKGDVLTGDGIERAKADAPLAPVGGEGGSVPQALGSKGEERAKRRKKKKDSYARYLESETWKKVRARALKRDKHKCLACRSRAQVVHHVRYPKNLGEEKLEWLYSLCVPCHDEIHRAATKMTLRKATDLVLDCPPRREGNVVYLPDDWQLSKSATKARQQRKGRKSSRKAKKQKKMRPVVAKKKSKIIAANEELHATLKANRERRERRASWQ